LKLFFFVQQERREKYLMQNLGKNSLSIKFLEETSRSLHIQWIGYMVTVSQFRFSKEYHRSL